MEREIAQIALRINQTTQHTMSSLSHHRATSCFHKTMKRCPRVTKQSLCEQHRPIPISVMEHWVEREIAQIALRINQTTQHTMSSLSHHRATSCFHKTMKRCPRVTKQSLCEQHRPIPISVMEHWL